MVTTLSENTRGEFRVNCAPIGDFVAEIQIDWNKLSAVVMHLYALTLQKPSSITQAVHGNFCGSKQQEIVVARGRVLEILKPDPNTGKLHCIYSVDTFSLVRCILPFRLTGSSKGTVHVKLCVSDIACISL